MSFQQVSVIRDVSGKTVKVDAWYSRVPVAGDHLVLPKKGDLKESFLVTKVILLPVEGSLLATHAPVAQVYVTC